MCCAELGIGKGYVTNLLIAKMPGTAMIAAYHDLWQVELSFRLTKSDLKARPVSCRRRHDTVWAARSDFGHQEVAVVAPAVANTLKPQPLESAA